MRCFLFLLISILNLNSLAGVELKKIDYELYFKWVTPPLEEIIEAYQKIFIKIDENLKEEMRYIPWRGEIYQKYKSFLKQCNKNDTDILKCSEIIKVRPSSTTLIYFFYNSYSYNFSIYFRKGVMR